MTEHSDAPDGHSLGAARGESRQPDPGVVVGAPADNGHVISGMTEAGIRAAIAQLETLLPERSCSFRSLWSDYVASLPFGATWIPDVVSLMKKPLTAFGDAKVVDMRHSNWAAYRNGEGKALSPTTRNLALRRTKAVLRWGMAEGRTCDSPFLRVKQEPARGKRQTEIPEDDDARVADAVPSEVGVFYRVMAGTGMRGGEVRLLRWDQIDLPTGTIRLAWDETKGRRAAVITLSDDAIAALKKMPRKGPHVFPSKRTGKPLSYSHFYSNLRAAFERLGLKAAPGDGRVHPHDTRHSVATRLKRRGAELTDIQGVLRHVNISQTAQYIVTRAEEIAAAARLLNGPRKGPHRAPRKQTATRKRATG